MKVFSSCKAQSPAKVKLINHGKHNPTIYNAARLHFCAEVLLDTTDYL